MLQSKIVAYVVDDEMLDSDDSFAIIQPVWSYADIYGSLEDYESSLVQFSTPQRLAFAIHWYASEVNNGGHDQFFFNSTGIVWPDALEGFRAIGAEKAFAILFEAASRFDVKPSRERDLRIEQLERVEAGFDDLDDRFYELDEDIYTLTIEYARKHRLDFYFNGKIETYELPDLTDQE